MKQQESFFSVWQQASQQVARKQWGVVPSSSRHHPGEERRGKSILFLLGFFGLDLFCGSRTGCYNNQLIFVDHLKDAFTSAWWKTRVNVVPFYGGGCWEKKSNRRRKSKRCLQDEAGQSGPWGSGVQCAGLQTIVFDDSPQGVNWKTEKQMHG